MKSVVYVLILVNMVVLGWLYQNRFEGPAPISYEARPSETMEPLVLLTEREVEAPVSAQPEIPRAKHQAVNPPDLASSVDTQFVEATASDADALRRSTRMSAAVETGLVRICQAIGPFSERKHAESFILGLAEQSMSTKIRAVQVEQPSGYWVYLPSMPLAEAQHIVRDFKDKGVQDYFLGRQNFISLGLFTDKLSADARVQAIKALGYSPRLEPRFLSREVYWVDIEEAEREALEEGQWGRLLAEFGGVRRQPLTCE